MMRSIQYGSKRIDYYLEYADRKSLGITVTPELDVVVKAPEAAKLEHIEAKLLKRAAWIIKQQSFFLGFYPRSAEKRFISGESHLYLGRSYRLRIEEGPKNHVHFNGRELLLTRRPRSKAKQVFLSWYRARAKDVFATLAEPWIERFKKYGVEPSGIYLQGMPTRWGSCTPQGRIILNPELIKAPKRCIEYVIVHELCHLVHPHHTVAFFKLQTMEMPDWEKWKDKLEMLLA